MGEHSVYTLRRRVYNWTWIRRHRRRQQHARDRREPGWFRLSRPRSSSLPRRAQRWSERGPPLWGVYRLEKQHMIPVRPRNHKQPMKRVTDRMAVAISRNLKKPAVRSDVLPCRRPGQRVCHIFTVRSFFRYRSGIRGGLGCNLLRYQTP